MNKAILMGRLTADPEVRYAQNENNTCIARYSLAVDRRQKDADGNYQADFIRVVAFGKAGEFAEKYFKKGMKVLVTGRIQTGSYKDQEGKTVYTTDIVAEDQEFTEKKADGFSQINAPVVTEEAGGFMNVPDDGDLPFAPPTR